MVKRKVREDLREKEAAEAAAQAGAMEAPGSADGKHEEGEFKWQRIGLGLPGAWVSACLLSVPRLAPLTPNGGPMQCLLLSCCRHSAMLPLPSFIALLGSEHEKEATPAPSDITTPNRLRDFRKSRVWSAVSNQRAAELCCAGWPTLVAVGRARWESQV